MSGGAIIKEKRKDEESTIARLRKDGEFFEVLVNCEDAMKAREGGGSVDTALLVHEIFKDARKGEKQGDLMKFFGTDDVIEIATEIINNGEIQLTQAYRDELTDKKSKQVISEIVRRAIDPKTKIPIPATRIELGMKQAGIKIDYLRGVNEQVNEVIDKLKALMPISIEELKVSVTVGPQFSGKIYGILKRYGNVIGQNYLNNGSTEVVVLIPGGLKNDLIDEVNSVTHGNAIIKEA